MNNTQQALLDGWTRSRTCWPSLWKADPCKDRVRSGHELKVQTLRLDGRAGGAVFNFRYKLTNLVITNIFYHSLDPSLYRGSTVLNFIYLFFKKWGALAPPAPPPARALDGLDYRSIISFTANEETERSSNCQFHSKREKRRNSQQEKKLKI